MGETGSWWQLLNKGGQGISTLAVLINSGLSKQMDANNRCGFNSRTQLQCCSVLFKRNATSNLLCYNYVELCLGFTSLIPSAC